MRTVLVTGSRKWTDPLPVAEALERDPVPTLLIHGGCAGLDLVAEKIAIALGILVERHNAEWKIHGDVAGSIRNQRMVYRALELKQSGLLVEVLAFPLASSRGTWDLVNRAKRAGLDVITWRDKR